MDASGLGLCMCRPTNNLDADGQVAWSWPPDAEVKSVDDATGVSLMMGAREPGPQGEREAAVKTIAQGRPVDRLDLWFCRVLFCCTRTMGGVPSMSDSLEVEVLYPA